MSREAKSPVIETQPRQAEGGPSILGVLAVSVVLAVMILAIVWFAFFRFH